MQTLDYIVIGLYAVGIVSLALWVSRRRDGKEKTAQDYFLAGNTLTWWAVGTSLIASNISAEQIIGMTGSGYALGLAIASYEWMAAITLVVVAKFLLPVYLEKKIYTMPQFLEIRYDGRVRTILAVFWILVYVFVNLTSILYLGSQTMEAVLGTDLWTGVFILAGFSALYSIYGGLMAVAWTDVVQVVVLVFGGLVTTFLALDAVGGDAGWWQGFLRLIEESPERFEMLFERGDTYIEPGTGEVKSAYELLPGLTILFGGMWIANLFYWGFNQYITQRALAAKSLEEAQRGMLFAGFLKMLMPLIVVIPGIAAAVLTQDMMADNPIERSDQAYPWLLAEYVPSGIKGLAFAALLAAIVSSLSSMINSVSTIFTMDIYRKQINTEAKDGQLVRIGRIVAAAALIIAIPIAPQLKSLDQAFQFIQEFTGYVSPGVLAIFLLGIFSKKTTANAAVLGALLTIPLGYGIAALLPDMPFLDRMGIVFVVIVAVMFLVSYLESKGKNAPNSLTLRPGIFKTSNIFNIGAIVIMALLAAIYLLLAEPPA